MDKRSLLFILSLTVTLMAVNLFFNYNSTEKNQEWQQQQKNKKEQQQLQLEVDIVNRTAPIDQLPLMEIYTNTSSEHIQSYGVYSDNAIITLSWNAEQPQKISFRKKGTQEKLRNATLSSDTTVVGSPAIYRETAEGTITAAHLPDSGHFDLQLITMSPSAGVFLGEYTNGKFRIPLTAPTGDAIAMKKSGDTFMPVGIYHHDDNTFIPLKNFTGIDVKIYQPKITTTRLHGDEEFFVLENDYQQLVFTNHGAALVEINLPFQSQENTASVVKEIGFDRSIKTQSPANAQFPIRTYYTEGKNTQGPFVKHDIPSSGEYYPLLRRNLITNEGKETTVQLPPDYYALNIVSEYPEMATLMYEVKSFDKEHIVFEAIQSHRKIIKTFRFSEGDAPYCIDVDIEIEGHNEGLWLTSGIPEVEMISGGPAPMAKYKITRNNKGEVEKINLPKKESLTVTSINPDWTCNSNGFFGFILDPLNEIGAGYKIQHIPGVAVPTRLSEIDKSHKTFTPSNFPGYNILIPLKNNARVTHLRFFAGPFDESTLKTVDTTFSDPSSGYNPGYSGSRTFHGWFKAVSAPFAKFLFIIMKFFHSTTNSWTLSIILVTIVLRVLLYPLNAWSLGSMKRMKEIAPEVSAIQSKYKKDPKRSQMEVMNLYRKKKINPLSGCFPILIQMPFLIGMFDLLKSAFVLRGETFIPGWIDNLAAPDVLFRWDTPIFLIGNEFHILPILLGVIMFLQQRLSSATPKDASKMTDQQRQQKTMSSFMTVFFAVMFYKLPSGLNIYWLCSMGLSLLQQYYINRKKRV